ncbi:MAG TPA: hypothetical protein VHD87_12415 [Acidimicrobiales bacterium]|nr:hypothetical protein [Acidimicrobiales bacterium]
MTMLARLSAQFADAAATAIVGSPSRVRLRVSPAGVARGQLDVVRVVLGGVVVAGLTIDRVDVRARRVRLVPGLPPVARAADVEVGATVGQGAVDAWTRSAALPVRLRFRPDGVAARAGIARVRLAEVVIDLAVEGRRLRLVPRRAEMLGVTMRNPSTDLLRVVLPLPPLPAGAQLLRLTPEDGSAQVWFSAPLNQKLTPRALAEVTKRLRGVVSVSNR